MADYPTLPGLEDTDPLSGRGHTTSELRLTVAVPDDPVNHPSHYTSHPSGVECIEITEHMGFNAGNAVKYLWRAGLKDEDAEIQDLEKAVWYINREIERRKKIARG